MKNAWTMFLMVTGHRSGKTFGPMLTWLPSPLPETKFSSLTSKSDIARSSRCPHDTPIRFPFLERVASPWDACVYHDVRQNTRARRARRARDRVRAPVLFSGLVEFGLDFRGFSVCRIFFRVLAICQKPIDLRR